MKNARKDILDIFLEAQYLPAAKRTTRWSGELRRKFARKPFERRRATIRRKRKFLFSATERKMLHALASNPFVRQSSRLICTAKTATDVVKRLKARGFVVCTLAPYGGKGNHLSMRADLTKTARRWLHLCATARERSKRKRRRSLDQRLRPDDVTKGAVHQRTNESRLDQKSPRIKLGE